MRSRTGILTMMAAALVLAGGCASSGKLAKQSQEQLAGGDTRKAYETALRAVAKNPYDTSALAALKASAQELLRHDGNRFRSLLVAADTTEAAEISLGMVAIRHTVARAGVTLVPDPQVAADERKARHAVAMRAALEGHDRFQEGNPKEACYSYAEARRLEPEETQWAAAFEEARVAATDRVLLLPYACDTRAPIDSRVLSDDMLASVTRFAEANLEFTELADPGDSWTRLSSGNGRDGRSVTHEAAVRMGQKNEATRVAWARIHGDRIESHSETRPEVLYQRVTFPTLDGTIATRWIPVPVLVRVEDRWVSVALECEVYSVADDRVVVRRTTDHGAGLRIVSVITPLPGVPGDWALHTPEQWNSDKKACDARANQWRNAYGTLSVDQLAQYARGSGRSNATTVTLRGARHGQAARLGRDYAVCYGSLPGESALMAAALGEAWKELAAVLAESDKS